MRLVFAGTPATALPTAEALLTAGHRFLAVITRPDAPAGRGRRPVASAVADFARARDLAVLAPRAPGALEAELQALPGDLPDLGVVVAYGGLLPPAVLAIPRLGWLNLHFSLLPRWRGAAPVQRALLCGDPEGGVSVFQLDAGLDTGPVFAQRTHPLGPTDTAGSVLDELSHIGAALVTSVVAALEDGTAVATPQPSTGVTLAPRVTVDEARIPWSDPALDIDRRIRACTPQPGAWTSLNGGRLRLGPVGLGGEPSGAEPGVVRVADGAVWVATGTTSVRLGWVHPAGRTQMAAVDWWRGLRSTDARFD